MKKNQLLTLIFLFVSLFAFSQNPITGIEIWTLNPDGVLEPTEKKSFKYDDAGNQTVETKYLWSERFLQEDSLNTFDIYTEEIKTYDASNRISTSVYTNIGSSSGYKNEKYFYYNDNCLETLQEDVFYNDKHFFRDITYYNPETCEIDSIEKFEDNQGSLKHYYVEKYFHTGYDELRILFGQDSLGQFTNEILYYETTRNEQGLITNYFTSFTDIGPESYSYDYDEYGNRIYYSLSTLSFFFPDSFELRLEQQLSHTYDDQEQIIETITETTNYNNGVPGFPFFSVTSYVYEYACDGLLNKKTVKNAAGTTTSVRIYEYKNGHNCDLPQDKDLLSIRPNFTQDYVFIESEILQTENCQIAIYDMAGRLIKKIKPNRVQSYRLYLQDLLPGNYIIHVFNKNYSESERVVKM